MIGLAVAAGLVNTAGKRTTFVVERRALVSRALGWVWVALTAGSLGKRIRVFWFEGRVLTEARGTLRSSILVGRGKGALTVGIYYPIGSLKSQLCIRGRDLLYERCAALDIRHKKTGKVSGRGVGSFEQSSITTPTEGSTSPCIRGCACAHVSWLQSVA